MMSKQTILGFWPYRVSRISFRDHLERSEKNHSSLNENLGHGTQRHKSCWAIWEAAVTVCMNSPSSQSCDHSQAIRHSVRPWSLWGEHKGKCKSGKKWFSPETKVFSSLLSTKQNNYVQLDSQKKRY